MDLNTPQAVIEKRINGVKRADVEAWLRDASIKVQVKGAITVLIHPSIPGGYKSLPFPLDDQETIRGTHLTTIAHLCKRITDDLARASGTYVDVGEDLPNWLAPLFRDGPFGMSIEGNRLTIYSKKYPEFQKAIDLNKGEAGVSHELKQMQGQLKAYVAQMAYYEEAGWRRETLGSEIRLLPPEDSQEQPIALTGSIGQLFSSLKHRDLTGLTHKELQHIAAKPPAEEVITAPSEVEPVTAAGDSNSANEPHADPSKTFVISEDCPPAQRKLFEAMNRQLEVFSIKKADFDLEFRLGLMKHCVDLAKAPAASLLRSLDAKTRAELLRQDKRARAFNLGMPTTQAQMLDVMTSLYVGVTLNPPNPSVQDCSIILTNIEASGPSLTTDIANHYSQKFGRFQDIDPTRLSAEERLIFDQFNTLVSGEAQSSPKHSDELILDNIAHKGALIDGSNELVWQIGEDQIRTVDLRYHAIVPLVLSIGKAVQKLDLPQALLRSEEPTGVLQEVMTSIMALIGLDAKMIASLGASDMAGLAALTHPHYGNSNPNLTAILNHAMPEGGELGLSRRERRILDRAQRKQATKEDGTDYTPAAFAAAKPREVPPEVLARLQAQRDARTREAEQQLERLAALEAARPTPYALEKTAADVFRRIEKVSEDDWSVIRNPEAAERRQQEIVRMRYLHKQELVPLHHLLNTKLPMHAEFGEVFFSEPVLKRAEYACLAIPEGKEKPIIQLDGIGAKLDSLLTQLASMNPEELPESQRASYQSIIRQLVNCPTLVVAALGSDQQLKALRALNNQILPRDALAPVARNFVASETVGWVEQRTSLAREILAARGIKLPEIAPAIIPIQSDAGESNSPSAGVTEPEPISHGAPVSMMAPTATEPSVSNFVESTPTAAVKLEAEEVTLYEELREIAKQRRDYSEAESAAISSARYKTQHFVEQEGCRELECRLKATKSGYQIQMIFGKDGKSKPSEYIPLYGVTHVDDAMDIFMALESTIFDEFSRSKNPDSYVLPPTRDLRPERSDTPVRPRVNVIRIQRDEQHIPQGIIDLDPSKIAVVDEPYAVTEPPKKRKAFTEAKIVNAGDRAMLVIHSWYATEKGNARTCSQMNIPLGIEFKQTDEAMARATFAINQMKNAILDAQPLTAQDVIDRLRKEVGKQQGKWDMPTTHYVPGFEQATKLNFPRAEHQQSTLLAPGTLRLVPESDTGRYYSLRLEFRIRDDSKPGSKWLNTLGRGINLHTSNPKLAEARAAIVMTTVRDFFENNLIEGQSNPSGVQLPENWRWDMSLATEDDKYVNRISGSNAEKAVSRTGGLQIEEAILSPKNMTAITDYAAGTYADDLAVQVSEVETGQKTTRFVLQLVRGMRDVDVTQRSHQATKIIPEAIHMVNPNKASDYVPVEIVMEIDNKGRNPQQIRKNIDDLCKKISHSTQDQATLRYRASVPTAGSELLKVRTNYLAKSVITDYVRSVRSHLRDHDDVDIARDDLNDAIRPHFTTAPRVSGSTWQERQSTKTNTDGHNGGVNGR